MFAASVFQIFYLIRSQHHFCVFLVSYASFMFFHFSLDLAPPNGPNAEDASFGHVLYRQVQTSDTLYLFTPMPPKAWNASGDSSA